jgi:hypothetical protein
MATALGDRDRHARRAERLHPLERSEALQLGEPRRPQQVRGDRVSGKGDPVECDRPQPGARERDRGGGAGAARSDNRDVDTVHSADRSSSPRSLSS